MGLDTSHDCWHGPYSQFHRWRHWLAGKIGLPLGLMQGFVSQVPDAETMKVLERRLTYGCGEPMDEIAAVRDTCEAATQGVPISWWAIADPLRILLSHSDCDGRIRWWDCKAIAIRLAQVYRTTTTRDDPEWRGCRIPYHRGCYDGFRAATLRFAAGCLRAYRAREDVIFR